MPPPPPPQPPEQGRINLGDLKSQIVKRVGPERAHRYFGYLNRLLSHKLSKPEFNKLCLSSLGHENLPLHNQLIHSILKNAFQAKVPPPLPAASKPVGDEGFNPSPAPVPNPPPTGWSNGDILPSSLRKCSSGIRRIKDPSPLGPNGRVDATMHQYLAPRNEEEGFRENGDLIPYDLKRPLQHQQGGPTEQPSKRPRTEPSPHNNQTSLPTKNLVEGFTVKDMEDTELQGVLSSARGPLQAPLGIPFCPASVGGARRSLPLSMSSDFATNYDGGDLCHTEVLRKRMEAIAQAQGLGGVTMDCANLLNKGLDTYLKRLIRSSVELVGARLGHEPIKQQQVYKQQPHGKPINGVWLGNRIHVQSSSGPSEGMPEPRNHHAISLQDFKVAMELNSQQLGEDWPLLLEKICLSSFEE